MKKFKKPIDKHTLIPYNVSTVKHHSNQTQKVEVTK